MLDCVTFTGADDSVDPADLAAISAEYPGVEWGILFSKRQGRARFPSEQWIDRLQESAPVGMKLSAHLCGGWVREFVIDGRFTWNDRDWRLMFDRVQLNFHAEPHGALRGFDDALDAGAWFRPFIMQCDGVHDDVVRGQAARRPGMVLPLFDVSGGAGQLPPSWPAAWPGVRCGYAGGLGPDNIVEQLTRITAAVGDAPFWIDMERRVRSDDDQQFDLGKVRSVLEQIIW